MTTMAALRTRVRTRLEETTAAVWSDAELDEGLTGALEVYSWVFPKEALGSLVVAEGATSATPPAGTLDVRRVTLADGSVVPRRGAPSRRTADEEQSWELFAGVLTFTRPLAAQTLTIQHTCAMTLADVLPADEGLLVLGGVAQALEARAVQDFKRGGSADDGRLLERARLDFERELDRRRRRVRAGLVSAP